MSKPEKKKRAADARGSSIVAPLELSNGQCIGILALLVAVFFHKILLGQAYFWEDFIYQNYPFRSFAATSLAQGELPLWNPYTFNGMPFLADIQTTVLYIPCLLLTLFVRDSSLSYYWLEVMIVLHFVLAGVGMFYLAKSFPLKNAPSLFAGAAYMLSGYMVVHAIHQQNVTLVAWYPLILLFFRNAMNGQGWLYVFLCALTLGHSILAGYPQLSLYLYFFLGLYFLFELLARFKLKELMSRPALIMSAKAASIVALSVLLAMVQLLPTLELSELSQRAQITFEKASEGSLAFSQLATLMFPKMFGTAGANGYEYFGPGTYWWFWETCVYLGALPLLLMAVSVALVKKNKQVAFFLGMATFSILFALGDYLSRRGRGGRAHVSNEVGDGEINLVAYSRNNWYGRGMYRPRHRLGVERCQVLHGAAAASGDYDVEPARLIEVCDGPGNLAWSRLALHGCGRDYYMHTRRAPL
jgi:hypothetical protein